MDIRLIILRWLLLPCRLAGRGVNSVGAKAAEEAAVVMTPVSITDEESMRVRMKRVGKKTGNGKREL